MDKGKRIYIPNKIEKEVVLKGGQQTEWVSKVGSNIHRSQCHNAPYVHQVLEFLSEKKFSYSPRFLGIDEKDREVLSFIDGEVPRECKLTFDQIRSAFKILRELHDIMSDSGLTNNFETVCHRDFAPWNLIVKGEAVVGIIDFDEATPGNRIEDLAYALWTFLDLGTSPDADAIQIGQVVALVNEYELDNRKLLVHALLEEQTRILRFRERMVVFSKNKDIRNFSKGAIKRIMQSMNWVNRHANRLNSALTT